MTSSINKAAQAPQADKTASLALVGATLVDGTGSPPLRDSAVLITDGRVAWVGPSSDLDRTGEPRLIDVGGKYVIPGLMDANVHLLLHTEPDVLLKYEPGCYDDLITEAAQIALRSGITTVFDTWGPLEPLRRVRDRINSGEVTGSRIYLAGNIIGNDGPFSPDFKAPSYRETLSAAVVERINHHWEQNVGARLTWMPADDVRAAVREYIATSDIDFVKFSSSAHAHVRFLAFSHHVQQAIVEEAHAAGMTAQACTQNPEALRVAIEAGVDLLQHGDVTGLCPIPPDTLDVIVDRQLPCVAFLNTDRHIAATREEKARWLGIDWGQVLTVKDENDRNLIRAGAKLMLAHDAGVFAPSVLTSPHRAAFRADSEDYPYYLGSAHMLWLRAAVERQMDPMDALLAATRNVAEGYRKADELGTIERGKRADLLVLDGSPLTDVENYGRIGLVVKDGVIIDHERLPVNPVLTRESDLGSPRRLG